MCEVCRAIEKSADHAAEFDALVKLRRTYLFAGKPEKAKDVFEKVQHAFFEWMAAEEAAGRVLTELKASGRLYRPDKDH